MWWIIGLLAFFGFLFFLFRFPRETLGCLGVVVGFAALLGYVLIFKPEQDRKHLQEQVVVSVSFDPKGCSTNYPLLIDVHNRSNKTIRKTSWDINVYQPGYSSDLSGYSNDYFSDKILQPGQSWSACYILPSTLKQKDLDPGKLEYKVSDKCVSFE